MGVEVGGVSSGGFEDRFEVDIAAVPDPVLVGGGAVDDDVGVDERLDEVACCCRCVVASRAGEARSGPLLATRLRTAIALAMSICSLGRPAMSRSFTRDFGPTRGSSGSCVRRGREVVVDVSEPDGRAAPLESGRDAA